MQQALILANERADLRFMRELQIRDSLRQEVERMEERTREAEAEREKFEKPVLEKDKSN